jgi:hypothetical protein
MEASDRGDLQVRGVAEGVNKSLPESLFILGRCRSQWPYGLRHEPSSPARTLGSRVRIPLEVWMSVFGRLFCV